MSHIALPSPDLAILQRRTDILKQLKKVAPGAILIADQEGRRTFETDALTAYRCLPLAVVLPENTEEVSAIVRVCARHRVIRHRSLVAAWALFAGAVVTGVAAVTLSSGLLGWLFYLNPYRARFDIVGGAAAGGLTDMGLHPYFGPGHRKAAYDAFAAALAVPQTSTGPRAFATLGGSV